MKHVLTFLALMVFQYLLIAFVNWNMNPSEWTESARFVYAIIFTTINVVIILAKELNTNEK
jgi:hypothetical protein